MYKKLFVLVPAVIILFLGLSYIVDLANTKSWYSYTTPFLALLLCFSFAKLWRHTFKSWYDWLASTSYDRNQAIKGRIKAADTLPPPRPTLVTTEEIREKLALMELKKADPYGDPSAGKIEIRVPKTDSPSMCSCGEHSEEYCDERCPN